MLIQQGELGDEANGVFSSQVRVMQNELKTVREFRKKRAEMQHQLDQLHASLEAAERDHKITTSQMEQQFFEEKVGT